MTQDDEATNAHGIDTDSIDTLRREAERQTDLSTSDIVTHFPRDMDADTLEAWAFLADAELLGDIDIDAVREPMWVAYWMDHGATSPKEAVRLSHFGPVSEDLPRAVAEAFANPLEWTTEDPTQVHERDAHCYGCGRTHYFGEVPKKGGDGTQNRWVNDSGHVQDRTWSTEDDGARPVYAPHIDGHDEQHSVLCEWCQDDMMDRATFLTLAFNGHVGQAMVWNGYVDNSYYDPLGRGWDCLEDILLSYADETGDIEGPWAREGDIDPDRPEAYTRIDYDIPDATVKHILSGEHVPDYPVVIRSGRPDIDDKRRSRQRADIYIPEDPMARGNFKVWAKRAQFTEGDIVDYYPASGDVAMVRIKSANPHDDVFEVEVTDHGETDLSDGQQFTTEANHLENPSP